MLIIEGHMLWLAWIVGLMLTSAVIALFTRDASTGEPVRPVVLSDEDRHALESFALELKKKAWLARKKRQAARREKAEDED